MQTLGVLLAKNWSTRETLVEKHFTFTLKTTVTCSFLELMILTCSTPDFHFRNKQEAAKWKERETQK